MTLIKSISGFRGTIGGKPNDGLTPLDIVKFTSAYGSWIIKNTKGGIPSVVVGRDARLSGLMVNNIVCGTLMGLGIDVFDLDLSTTPTVEMAVTELRANGGIILTASHNPKQWNALKLLNSKGEFISEEDGKYILQLADKEEFSYCEVNHLGKYTKRDDMLQKHFEKILKLPYVDVKAIGAADFSVSVDAVNSCGGFAVPMLLEALGVKKIHKLYCDPDGNFAHNPEP
ncbi:MAG TPA: phosphoglucosamine mutase, partial [Bacteroidia bacterium]|nr:phosphoglucosamine mutase [Bacteroidia bacterium]